MDEAPVADAGEPADAGPVESGDTGAEAPQTEDGEVEAPSRQYVEIDDPDNRYERVRVAGEELEVPYSELVRGYSREADYTRKTQELAQQRQQADFGLRLQQALEADPRMTLQILAQQHGLSLAEAQAQVDAVEEEYADPLERELVQERRARESLEQRINQREADEHLERAVTGLQRQYNVSDEDMRAVIGTAYQMNLGVEALPLIYKTMAFDRIAARVEAARAEQARQQAETTRRTAAKTQASSVIGNGRGAGNGLTDQVDAGGRMSLRQAIEAAFDQAEQ